MLTLLSPAKSLDFSAPPSGLRVTQPQLDEDIATLVERCKELDVATLRKLMKLSKPLGELNHQRFQEMALPFTPDNSKPCLLAFRGDVYRGIDADTM